MKKYVYALFALIICQGWYLQAASAPAAPIKVPFKIDQPNYSSLTELAKIIQEVKENHGADLDEIVIIADFDETLAKQIGTLNIPDI